MVRQILIVLTCATALVACQFLGPAESDPVTRMLVQINSERASRGLAELKFDERLNRTARAHAADMAERDYFSHQVPGGNGLQTRLQRAGYRWRRIAENIAAGQASPEATVAGWMQSEGHRHNILTAEFHDAGIGHVFREKDGGSVRYGHYWTLVLGQNALESL